MRIRSEKLAILLSGWMICAGAFSNVAYAAPVAYVPQNASEIAQTAVNGRSAVGAQRVNTASVTRAIDAINKAKRDGARDDIINAQNLIKALQPVDKLKLYVELTRAYYLKEYRNKGFKFFNVERYLASNGDVCLNALKYSPDDIYSYALNHYLEHGFLEGRSSGTEYDPMAAILAKPEITMDLVISTEKPTAEQIFDAFVRAAGKTTTDSYVVLGDSLTVLEKADPSRIVPANSIGANESQNYESSGDSGNGGESPKQDEPQQGEPQQGEPQRGEPQQGEPQRDEPQQGEPQRDEPQQGEPQQDEPKQAEPQQGEPQRDEPQQGEPQRDAPQQDEPQQQYRQVRYINNKAKDITPYTIYRDSYDNESFTFTSYNPFDDINSNKAVDVRFMGENYRRAKELSEGKKYTLMLYFCGTNLESDPYNRSVSSELVSMMQADMSNVNVILCVGGTLEYGNSLMNTDAADGSTYGASGLRSGIYYLDPGALSSEVREKLKHVDTDKGDAMYELAGKKTPTSLSQGLHFDDIITSDSFIQLVSTSAVDMADPSYLAGFINLSTNLFPADNYGLTLSDHGGGLEEGVIFPDTLNEGGNVFEENGITVYELESALASTDLYRDENVSSDGKLGIIFYNACLMGSTGQAYNTKDYYRYMVASEETSSGHTAYSHIISDLNQYVEMGRSDRDIAIRFAQIYEEYPSTHHGYDNYYVGSIAAYSSEDMDNIKDNLNALAREFSKILGTEDNSVDGMKQDVFMAIRKASLSCYPTNGAELNDYYGTYKYHRKYVDIGELLNHVKYNLSILPKDGYSDSDRIECERLMKKLDIALNSGFLTYLSVYSTETGGIHQLGASESIPLNYSMDVSKNIWTDIRVDKNGVRDYLYGSSIYMPLDETVNDYHDSKYYQCYKDSDLNDYVEFINDYLKCFNNDNGYAKKICNLKDELSDLKINKLIIGQDHDEDSDFIRTIVDDDNNTREYLSFKIAESYEDVGLETPANSTGSPMLDILETQNYMTLTAIHKEAFRATDERNATNGELVVDMICAEEAVTPFAISLASSTISFDVSDKTKSIITGITLEGNKWDRENSEVGDSEWQFVIRSYVETNDDAKDKVLEELFGEYDKDIKTLTVYGTTLTTDGDNKYDSVHVFKENNDGDYDYCGSVKSETDSIYNKINSDDVVAISAYHFVIQEEENGNLTKKTLENLGGIEPGFFAVSESETKPYLKTNICITEKTEDGSWSGKTTGYYVDLPGDHDGYTHLGNPGEYQNFTVNVGNGPLEEIIITDSNVADIESVGEYTADYQVADTAQANEAVPLEIHDSLGIERADEVTEPATEPETEALEPAAETEVDVSGEASEHENESEAAPEPEEAGEPEPASLSEPANEE
jgi:hypothetical protein